MPMRRITAIIFLFIAFSAAPSYALERGDALFFVQGGGVVLDGKLGELFQADFAFGAGMGYGATDYVGLEWDVLYSEHEQSDKDKYGQLQLTHGVVSLGPRLSLPGRHVSPYLTLAPFFAWTSYEARYPAGSGTDEDSLDSHGFGGLAQLGLDFYVSGGVTLGLAGRASVTWTDMEFATGADVDNKVDVYSFYAGLVRLGLLF
ncbi:MAG: hypothetical protein M5R36_08655 [Deltaproteobacteria bacterium]|nr:hypothetical protein [Deltaproteobacteria bacterium]